MIWADKSIGYNGPQAEMGVCQIKHEFVLTDFISNAMALAEYEELEDATYCGRIQCLGVVAFEETEARCKEELQATLEDWIVVGLRERFSITPVAGIDLGAELAHESVESL